MAKFEIENSVLGDLMTLLAMNGNITFAELLGFLVEGIRTLIVQNYA